jgi:hypothetical protein
VAAQRQDVNLFVRRRSSPANEPGSAPARYPHCDADVLHAPGACVYCDLCPEAQAARIANGVNFTGEDDPDKEPCPATARRPVEIIERWGGNQPTTEEDLERMREDLKAAMAEAEIMLKVHKGETFDLDVVTGDDF